MQLTENPGLRIITVPFPPTQATNQFRVFSLVCLKKLSDSLCGYEDSPWANQHSSTLPGNSVTHRRTQAGHAEGSRFNPHHLQVGVPRPKHFLHVNYLPHLSLAIHPRRSGLHPWLSSPCSLKKRPLPQTLKDCCIDPGEPRIWLHRWNYHDGEMLVTSACLVPKSPTELHGREGGFGPGSSQP